MASGHLVRTAAIEDFEAMRDLHVAAILAVDPSIYSPEALASWAHGLSPAGYAASMAAAEEFEVAVDRDGRVVAFCGVKNGEVFGLYVHPRAQGANLGAILLRRGEDRARRQRPDADHFPLSASLNAVRSTRSMAMRWSTSSRGRRAAACRCAWRACARPRAADPARLAFAFADA
jgi:GNAT superfamily N-acetyltransferase